MAGAGAPRVLGHTHIGGQVTRDDSVEEDEDTERQPEEDADDGEEERLSPGRVHISGAGGVDGVVLEVRDGEHGGGEYDGEEPGHETHQPSLVLGPDESSSQWQTHGVVPDTRHMTLRQS